MKSWPEEGGTVRFSDIADPLRDAIDQIYELRRKPPCDVEWTGYGFPGDDRCEQPEVRLTARSLDYDEHEQCRDPMRVIIGLAVQLGIEQGVRAERSRRESQQEISTKTWEVAVQIGANSKAGNS